MQCPECLFENPENAKFCMDCAASLIDSQLKSQRYKSQTEGERKTATVLFSDLSGYTAMVEKIDPEEIKNFMGDIFEKAGKIVEKYQGTVERFFGDEIMILFGVPKAHEDDPSRAIHTAIEIHALVDNLSPEFEKKYHSRVSMHTGINTGLVITGDQYIGKGRHGLTGDTINLAKRLTSAAKQREIIVGETTYQKVKHKFNFKACDPVRFKGKTNLVKTYKIASDYKKPQQINSGFNRQIFSEIVGRDTELSILTLQVEDVIKSKGSVVNIVGEAGIGKSRLFAEFSKLDIVKDITLLEGKAISIGRTLPFYPIVDFLKNWAKIEDDDHESVALSKLESLVKSIDKDNACEISPFIATMMGLKLSEPFLKRMEGIAGESLEKLIFKHLRDFLIKAAKKAPLVIVMEDLHWADESSIELLQVLFNLTKDYSLVFVNVFRPDFSDTGDKILDLVQNDPSLKGIQLLLKPLDAQLTEQMVNNMLKSSKLSYDIQHKIIERTGGNPFFIEEVVRSFIDEGAIILKDNEFILTDKINQISVPHTIADLLTARIDRLEHKTRDLIKIASVIGRHFFYKILVQVASSVEDIDKQLSHLKDIQLIREKENTEEVEYLFKHALAQEVAYKSLLRERRRELHLNVAKAIETIFKDRLYEFYGTLSYHYTHADDLDKAEEYMLKAGEEAMKASATSEALGFYKKALDMYINKHGENVDKLKIADLQENIGNAFFNKGIYVEAFEYFNKSQVNRGEKEWKLGALQIFRLMINFIVILRRLYLPSFGKKKPSSPELEKRFKRNIDITNSLITVDVMRCFFQNLKNLRGGFQYDISMSQGGLNMVAGGIGLFPLTGISSGLSDRFDQYIQKTFKKKENNNNLLIYWLNKVTADFIAGIWQSPYDEEILDKAYGDGDFFPPTGTRLFDGYAKIEIADFKTFDHIIKRLSEVGTEYNFLHAQSDVFVLKSKFAMKTRNTRDAISYIETGIALSIKDGWPPREVELLGIKARLHMIDNDFERAEKTFIQTEQIINKIGKTSVFIPWMSDYYIGLFDFNVQKFAKAVNEDDNKNYSAFKKAALKSGRAALNHSKLVASDRTETYKLMGKYFWLINQQKKAMEWWIKSIEVGERLGHKIELPRTYFEAGKSLLSPESKTDRLNGITAREYLDKARLMFEEMDFQWDLNQMHKKYV